MASFNSHQFSNVSIQLGQDEPSAWIWTIPNGVFKDSRFNSRRSRILRYLASPRYDPGVFDRTQRTFGGMIYIKAFQGALSPDDDHAISRANCIHADIIADMSGDNFFQPSPFAFTVLHWSHVDTPAAFYPGSNVFEFMTKTELSSPPTATNYINAIDAATSLITTVDAVLTDYNTDNQVRDYIEAQFGAGAYVNLSENPEGSGPHVAGQPFHSAVNTYEVPPNLAVNGQFGGGMLLGAALTALRYGAPLNVTWSTSIPSPQPDYDIASYRFDLDTDAS